MSLCRFSNHLRNNPSPLSCYRFQHFSTFNTKKFLNAAACTKLIGTAEQHPYLFYSINYSCFHTKSFAQFADNPNSAETAKSPNNVLNDKKPLSVLGRIDIKRIPLPPSLASRLFHHEWLLKLAKISILFLSTGAILAIIYYISYAYLPHDNPLHKLSYQFYIYYLGVIRFLRDIRVIALTVFDYKYSLWGLEGIEYDLKLSEVHTRCARRLRDLTNSNGGVYLKFAQHIAQAKYLLPDEYVTAMADSMQRAPTCTYEDVRDTIKEELGDYPEALFKSFDPKPIASASLAQVHFAILHDGTPVAVKVQHRFLIHTIQADIAIVDFLVHAVHKILPEFDYNWLAETVKQKLPLECDFTIEAKNSERCAANFAHRDDVAVPKIFWNLTKSRVLTMERMDGVICTDRRGIYDLGINPVQISEIMAEVFSEMTFETGWLHADPHEGNVFVRLNPVTHKPQIVLLDHGLYAELSPEFRVTYAKLWKALIEADMEKVKKYTQMMNVGDLWILFSGMLTRKKYEDLTSSDLGHLQQSYTAEEGKDLQKLAIQYGMDMQKVLARVPIEVILVMKTNDCLRYVDQSLNTHFNSHIVMARYCIHAINKNRATKHPGIKTKFKNAWEIIKLETKIVLFEGYLAWSSVWKSIKSVVTSPARYMSHKLLIR